MVAARFAMHRCGTSSGDGVEVDLPVHARDQFTIEDGAAPIQGIDQTAKLGQGVADLATGPGADLQATVHIEEGAPAIPFDLPRPGVVVPLGLAGGRHHGSKEGRVTGYEYGQRRSGDPPGRGRSDAHRRAGGCTAGSTRSGSTSCSPKGHSR